jgi:hypothetical protein
VDVSTRRRSRRQTQLPPTKTREAKPDDSNDANADYVDLSGPTLPPDATVNANAPTRRRSSRREVPTSGTSTPVPPPPSTATVNTPTRRRSSRRVIPTSSTATHIPPPTATVNTLTRRRSSRRVIPTSSTGTPLPPPSTAMDTVDISSAWEDRLSKLADYRKIHGHCNVPTSYSENNQLGIWVSNQRRNYNKHRQGKTSPTMTTYRIQALESLGFEWKPSTGRRKVKPKKPSIDDHATRARERAVDVLEHVQTTAQAKTDCGDREIRTNQVDVAFVPGVSDWNSQVHLGYILDRTEES